MTAPPRRLSFLDGSLTLWIFATVALGIVLGATLSGLPDALKAITVGATNIPIAIGLILMMYPPLAKMRDEDLPQEFADKSVLALVQNWIVGSVPICLGLPFLAGFLTRRILIARRGADWYGRVFLPKIGPITLVVLLLTIMAMFSLKGGDVLRLPLDEVRIAIPLAIHFMIQFIVGFAMGVWIAKDHPLTIAISAYGLASPVAFAAVTGPLVEVRVLILLVRVALRLGRRWFPDDPTLKKTLAGFPNASWLQKADGLTLPGRVHPKVAELRAFGPTDRVMRLNWSCRTGNDLT